MNINDLQISKGNWHSGLTQATHLHSFFLTKPALASAVVTLVYNKVNGYKNALSTLTTGLGRSKELNGIQYRWPLMGDSQKAVAVTRAFTDGGSTPGIAGSQFRVGFAEKWFAFGDVLKPDSATNIVARVMSEPFQEGSDYIYNLQLVTNDPTLYLDPTLIAVGKEFSKEYNVVSHDHSRTSGETTYATPFWMENYMTTFRKKYSITGAAHSQVLEIALVDPESGKTTTTWVKYAEWVFWMQWMDELELAFIYGQLNVKADGTTDMKDINGNPIYTGAGVEQQIAPANKRYYTRLTERTIRSFMNDLSFGGNDPGPKKYVALCGRGFMDLFDQAMKVSASNYTLVDSKFITGSGSEMTFGGQFKTYIGLNGDEITLKEIPAYNSILRNRALHPDTGLPIESYKATFLNFKIGTDGESNVIKVYNKDREMVSSYIEGLYGPFGPKRNGTSASAVDGYDFHVMSECGIMIKDPTNCGQMILDAAALTA